MKINSKRGRDWPIFLKKHCVNVSGMSYSGTVFADHLEALSSNPD